MMVRLWRGMIMVLMLGLAAAPAAEAAGQPSSRVQALLVKTLKLRTVGIIDAGRLEEFFAAEDGKGPKFVLGTPRIDDPIALKGLWAYFFRGSQVFYGALDSRTPVVGYYNPLVDAWLLTVWNDDAADPAVIASAVTTTAELSGGASDDDPSPGWQRDLGQGPLLQAFQGRSRAAALAFVTRYPERSTVPPLLEGNAGATAARTILLRRAGMIIGLNGAFADDSALTAAEQRLTQALAAGDRTRLQALLPADQADQIDLILRTPPQVRQGLIPLLALRGEHDLMVMAAPQSGARFVVLSHFSVTDGTVRLVKIGLLDFYPGTTP